MRLILSDDEIALAELLNNLAFGYMEYNPEVLEGFRRELANRGFKDSHISGWRKNFLLRNSATCHCDSCHEDLILDEAELVNGAFVCETCKHKQRIWYQNLEPSIVEPNLLDKLRSEDDYTQESGLSDKMTTEQLNELLTMYNPSIDEDTQARIRCRLVLRTGPQYLSGTIASGKNSSEVVLSDNQSSLKEATASETTVAPQPTLELLPEPDTSKMSNTDILEALAFRRDEYSSEGIQKLERGLLALKYKLSDVDAWRNGEYLSSELIRTGNRSVETRPSDVRSREFRNIEIRRSQVIVSEFKSATIRSQLLLGLFLGVVVIDALMVTQYVPSVNIFQNIWPESPLGSGGLEDSRSVVASLSLLKIGLLLVSMPIFLSWLFRCFRNTESLGAPSIEVNWARFGAPFAVPFYAYYYYYHVSKKILLASSTDYYRNNSQLAGAGDGTFPMIWELILLIANPFVLESWATALAEVVRAHTNTIVAPLISNQSDWMVALVAEVLVSLGIISYVWTITEAQRDKAGVVS